MTHSRRSSSSSCSSYSEERHECHLELLKVKVLTNKQACRDHRDDYDNSVGVLVSWNVNDHNRDDVYIFKLNGMIIVPSESPNLYTVSKTVTLLAQSRDPSGVNFVPGFGEDDKKITLCVCLSRRGHSVTKSAEFYSASVKEIEDLDAVVVSTGQTWDERRYKKVQIWWSGGENTDDYDFYFNCVKKYPTHPSVEDIAEMKGALFAEVEPGNYKIEVVAKNAVGFVQRMHVHIDVPDVDENVMVNAC